MVLRRIEYTVDYAGLTTDEAVAIEDRISEAVAEILLNGCPSDHAEPHDSCPGFGWVGTSTPVCEHCGRDIKCFETHVPNGDYGCLRMFHVHPSDRCEGQHCVIHHPSDHHMREWPLNWRDDRKLMERICPHGVGHPDPDDINIDHIHGCDGCCRSGITDSQGGES